MKHYKGAISFADLPKLGFKQVNQLMKEIHNMLEFENSEPVEKPLTGDTGFKVAKTILGCKQ